jgi:hypothetical protein
MKPIHELFNQFTKKSFGHKTNQSSIVDVQQDEPTLWSRLMDYSEQPHISFKITDDEIYNDLNKGRE